MSKTKPLTAAALKTLVKVSEATLSRWIKKGIPHQRAPTGRGGAPMLLFKLDDALEWIEMNASTGAATMARAARSGKDANTPEAIPTAAELPNVDELDGEGLLECLARLQRTERETYQLLQRLKRAGDVSGVRLVSERYVAECRALSAIEQASLNYRLRIGELARVSDMESAYMRVLVSVKNAVLGIPANIMPLIIPHLRRPESAHEISRLLDARCRDALRSAAERGRAERAAREAGATGKGKGKSASRGVERQDGTG
jgi:phage terminase Nu1 subunit (DNA packaging protein)